MAGEMLALMLDHDPSLLKRVMFTLTATIATSFTQDKSRATQAEMHRRYRICEQAFRELRTDYGWAVPRILDAMPRVLRARLDGLPWDPSKQRAVWLA